MKHLVFLLLTIFTLSVAPQSAFAVIGTTNAATTTMTTTPTTFNKEGVKKVKKVSKFKMWVLKTMAKAADTDSRTLVAALLAFFLGGLGIHRVYLGSKPIMILFYIITFFGIFGILPLIDFIIILVDGTKKYEGSNKFFAF